MTKVINLIGASGIGKSTTAAALFAEMKMRGLNCELVSEYVKSWAYEKKVPSKFDQAYLFAKQARKESILYGKVDYIITDSPLWLSSFYENLYIGREIIAPAVRNYLNFVRDEGVEHIYFWLHRNKPYDPRGRYETEEQSKKNHVTMERYLIDNGVKLVDVPVDDRERVEFILKKIL